MKEYEPEICRRKFKFQNLRSRSTSQKKRALTVINVTKSPLEGAHPLKLSVNKKRDTWRTHTTHALDTHPRNAKRVRNYKTKLTWTAREQHQRALAAEVTKRNRRFERFRTRFILFNICKPRKCRRKHTNIYNKHPKNILSRGKLYRAIF